MKIKDKYKGLERMFVLVMFILVICTGSAAEDTSEDDTYYIHDVFELQAIDDDTKGDYILANDIDASVTREWNSGKGFLPVGRETPFNGSFNGNGYTITGLYIDRTGNDDVALFSSVGEDGTLGSTSKSFGRR